jgi:hypothetical protein
VLGHTMVSQNELVFDRCKQNLIYMYYSGTHYWLTTMHIFPLFKKAMYVMLEIDSLSIRANPRRVAI